jgi:hypothetical protein
MFAAASRREFDILVTWALDRLSREGVAKTFEHIKQDYAATASSTSAIPSPTSAPPDWRAN